jgi:RNA polymerase sigma factor (sigma-70 family)
MTTFDEPQLPFQEAKPDTQLQLDEAESQPSETLQHLVMEVQRQPVLSPERQRGLTKLVQEIWKQPTIGILKGNFRKKYWSLSSGLYEDLFNEALQETLVAISRYIDSYDSQRSSFITWICGIFSNKFSDAHTKYSKRGIKFIPKSKEKNCKQGQVISLDDLEEFVAESLMFQQTSQHEENRGSDCDLLRELLINDPDNVFKNAYVKGKPHANFQYIAISIYVEGKNMQQLSSQLGITYSTLDSFFKRRLKKLEAYFLEHLQAEI